MRAALGKRSFVETYMYICEKISMKELEILSSIANTQSQAALAGFTHGLMGQVYFLCTIEESLLPYSPWKTPSDRGSYQH